MRSGPLLAETPLAEFRALGVWGEPAWSAHGRLSAALERSGAGDCAGYFARPQLDERRRMLLWHAGEDGPVRAWTNLSAEERAAAVPRILAVKERLAQLCAQSEADGRDAEFARLLRRAAVAPGLEHLYLVGDRPVLTAWGFEAEHARFDTLGFAAPAIAERPATHTAPAMRDWSWLLGWWWLPLALLLFAGAIWGLWRWHPGWTGLAFEAATAPAPEASVPAEPSRQAPRQAAPSAAVPAAPSAAVPAAPKIAAEPPRSGEVLAIPERGVDFLEGAWRTDSALVDRKDHKPLVQTFTFGRDGWGEVVTRRSDGVECRGRARAQRTAEGGLVIYGVEQAACSDGNAFVPFRLECAPGAGTSQCRGVNADDGSSYEVVVRRL